jgi:hypothetical protein
VPKVPAGRGGRPLAARSARAGPTGPPLSRDQLTGRGTLAVGVAVGCLAAVLITVAWLARRSLDRRRMAGWDADWLATGPRWISGVKAPRVVTEVPIGW